jgi:hypothetical protein
MKMSVLVARESVVKAGRCCEMKKEKSSQVLRIGNGAVSWCLSVVRRCPVSLFSQILVD